MSNLTKWDDSFTQHATTGLEVDGYIFQKIFKPYTTKIEHRAWIDIYGKNHTVRLFMEHLHRDDMLSDGDNWFMINQELLERRDVTLLKYVKVVIVKTDIANKLMTLYKQKTDAKFTIFFLGFTSIIKSLSNMYTMDYNKYLHLAGASWMKNTPTILETWCRHPEWPVITILCRKYCLDNIKALLTELKQHYKRIPSNIDLRTDLVPFEEVQMLLETSGVQLVTSESEGWGHYIHEARAHAALCVYSDYPPMNEFFTANKSGVPVIGGKPIKMLSVLPGVYGIRISIQGLEAAMEHVFNLSTQQRIKIGMTARTEFYNERRDMLKRSVQLRQMI